MSSVVKIKNEIKERNAVFLTDVLMNEQALYLKIQSALEKFHEWDSDARDKMFEDQKKIISRVIKDISGRINNSVETGLVDLQNGLNTQYAEEQVFGFYYWDEIIKILLRENADIIHVLQKYIHQSESKFKSSSIKKTLEKIIKRHNELSWMLTSYLSFKILCARKLETGTDKISEKMNKKIHAQYIF